MILSIMERFNYPSIAAVRQESVELIQMIKLVDGWGYKRVERETAQKDNEDLEQEMANIKRR